MPPLDPFRLERYFAAHEFVVESNLAASDCESVAIEELLDLADGGLRALLDQRLGYTESDGHPELRAAIADGYAGVGPDQVLVHVGAQEGILTTMLGLLQAGQHVVVQQPAYQSLYEVAASVGAEVDAWPVRALGQRWSLELEDLERVLRPETRMVVVNVPHNPTGVMLDRQQWDALHALAEERGFLLFCDEAYRGLEYRDSDRLPAGVESSGRALSLGILSKGHGLPGLRIGWVACRDTAVLDALRAVKDYTTICAPAPSELLATIALRHGAGLLERNRQRLLGHLQLLQDFAQRHRDRIGHRPPAAGPVCFPEWLGSGAVEEFAARGRERGLLLLPGTVFDPESRHFRIGFGRADFPQALAGLDRFLSEA